MVSHSSLRPESVTNTPEHLVARTRGQFTACIRPAPSPSQVKSSSSKQTRSFLAFRPPGLSPDISDSLLLGRSGASRQPCAVAQSPPSLGSAFKDQPQRERERERESDTRCHRLRAPPRCRSPLRGGAIATPVLTLLRSAPGGWERAPTECGGGGSGACVCSMGRAAALAASAGVAQAMVRLGCGQSSWVGGMCGYSAPSPLALRPRLLGHAMHVHVHICTRRQECGVRPSFRP